MQVVMIRSANGSITISLTTFLTFSHAGQHSQMRRAWANLYQQGGHFCLDSSNSDVHRGVKTKMFLPESSHNLFQYPSYNEDWVNMLWHTIPTLQCAGYDTSYTISSVSGCWGLEEVNRLPVCSSASLFVLCVSGVSLETETIVTDATVLHISMYSSLYSSYKSKATKVKGNEIMH